MRESVPGGSLSILDIILYWPISILDIILPMSHRSITNSTTTSWIPVLKAIFTNHTCGGIILLTGMLLLITVWGNVYRASVKHQ